MIKELGDYFQLDCTSQEKSMGKEDLIVNVS